MPCSARHLAGGVLLIVFLAKFKLTWRLPPIGGQLVQCQQHAPPAARRLWCVVAMCKHGQPWEQVDKHTAKET